MSSLPSTQSLPELDTLSLADSTVSAASVLENMDIVKLIISMVGKNQYCFIALVNQRWKQAYLDVFPRNRTTELNASTEEHARLCWEDLTGVRNSTYLLTQLCSSAASHGSLPALQFLRSVKCSWDAETCKAAAKKGHFDVLKWCQANGCPWDAWTCKAAARNGHFDVLKWCRDNGCPWDEFTCTAAAHNGHIDVLKWCRANGCPWNTSTCLAAAENGHFDILKWCRDNGCPWNRSECVHAALGNGQMNVASWIHAADRNDDDFESESSAYDFDPDDPY